jgi:WD40 repeat protein
MRISGEYVGYACCLIIFFMIFLPAGAATIPLAHSDFEIWNGQLTDRIYDLAISDDGHYVAVGSRDGTVSLVDQSGKLLWAYNNMKANGLLGSPDYGGDKWASVALSSDGGYVAAGIWDNEEGAESPKIIFFDRAGNLLWTYNARNVADVAITPDGKKVAVVADNKAILLNNDGSVVWEYSDLNSGDSVSISGDGSQVAWTGDANSARVLDADGSLVWEKNLGSGIGGGAGHVYGDLSADGMAFLVVQSGAPDADAALFGNEGNLLWSHTEPDSSMNYGKLSSDGEYSVLGMKNIVSLFDRKGAVIWTENFSAGSISGNSYSNSYIVDISRDGSLVAAAAKGYGVGRDTLVLMTKSDEILWTAKVPTERLAISADGEYIVSAAGNTLYLFKKDRNSTNPPYTIDLKSGVRYDTKSYVGDYIFSKYLTVTNLVIVVIIVGLLAGIGYGILRLKNYISNKVPDNRYSKIVKYLIVGGVILVVAYFSNAFLSHNYSFQVLAVGSPLNNLLLMISGILIIGTPIVTILYIIADLKGYRRK